MNATSTGSIDNIAANGTYDIGVLIQNLVNTSDQIQTVTYTLTPFIDEIKNHSPCYNTTPQIVQIKVVPQIKYTFKSKAYIGGKNIKCFGESNGSSRILGLKGGLPEGSGAPYIYNWSTGSHLDSIYNVKAGTYKTTISDKLGCFRTDSVTLTQPAKLQATDSIVNIKCSPGSKGAIYLHTTGGSEGIGYRWLWKGQNVSATTENLLNIQIGDAVYFVNIKDSNKCETNYTYYVQKDKAPNPNLNISQYQILNTSVIYNTSCYGKADGFFEPSQNSEDTTSIISYKWTYPDGDIKYSQKIYSLDTGLYKLEVIDIKGCTNIQSQFIKGPDPLTYNKTISSYPHGFQVKCYGDLNGQIVISDVKGGYGNHEYIWSTADGTPIGAGDTLSALDSLGTGHYKLTIQDAWVSNYGTGYCAATDSFILAQPNPINIGVQIPLRNGFAIPCFDSSALIAVRPSGGFGLGNFSYVWNGIPSADTSQILKEGWQKLTVIDDVCRKDTLFRLQQPGTNGGYRISVCLWR